jgi:hypothetical protein
MPVWVLYHREANAATGWRGWKEVARCPTPLPLMDEVEIRGWPQEDVKMYYVDVNE